MRCGDDDELRFASDVLFFGVQIFSFSAVGETKLEGVATKKTGAREHGNLRLTRTTLGLLLARMGA